MKTSGQNKIKRFELRLTDTEYKQLIELEEHLGMNRSDIIRVKVFSNSRRTLINNTEMLRKLDLIGAELGRSGNNINQLARHANILNKQGMLRVEVSEEFNSLLSLYLKNQEHLEKIIRQTLQLMSG